MNYINTLNRISEEAKSSNFFDHIITKTDTDILNDNSFMESFGNLLNYKRGYGYWVWKPYLINKLLNEIKENDIIVYADAGCIINKNGMNRFNEYIDMVTTSDLGIISFELPHIEKIYTTREIFEATNTVGDRKITDSGQYMATVLIMKKCENVINIFKESMDTILKNPILITDRLNCNQNREYFIDNRHDQSILSVIRKKHGSIVISDETYAIDFRTLQHIPILATRKV